MPALRQQDVNRSIMRSAREGVALVIVLGMLALMVLMGVAFSIYMRTERLAAGNYRNDVQVRQLLHVALNRALVGIETGAGIDTGVGLSTNIYPPWDVAVSVSTGEYVDVPLGKGAFPYLPLGAFEPQGESVANGDFLVITSTIPGLVPFGSVLNLTDMSFGTVTQILTNAAASLEIRHTRLQGGGQNRWASGDRFRLLQPMWTNLPRGTVAGRVGYVVINASGLIDANYAGNDPRIDRGLGTNANEIQIDILPESADASKLASKRDGSGMHDGKYETIQDLSFTGYETGSGVFQKRPQSFVTFSAAPTSQLVNVGGDWKSLTDPARKVEIIAAFASIPLTVTNAGCVLTNGTFTPQQAGTLYTNLVDYVDPNLIPGDLGGTVPGNTDGPFVEPVPMLNEVLVTNRVCFTTNAVGKYVVSGTNTLSFECIYPFPAGTDRKGYTLNYRVQFAGPESAYLPGGGLLTNSIPIDADLEYTVKTEQAVISGEAMNPLTIGQQMTVTVAAWIKHGEDVVDATTNRPLRKTITLSVSGDEASAWYDWECKDPRMNWTGDDPLRIQWAQPRSANNTLGTTNTLALDAFGFGPTPYPERDGDMAMFVANRPLRTAGELGYLFYADPRTIRDIFQTVRLYSHGTGPNGIVHPVLSYFNIRQTAGKVFKGLVNLNTRNTNVIGAVYTDMPVNNPHQPVGQSATYISPAEQDATVKEILAYHQTCEFFGVGDLGRVDWASIHPGGSDLDRESFVRNAADLFTVRQNIFTILLCAQTTRTVVGFKGESVVGGGMAVAEVWRDPVPSADGKPHSYLLRTFKIVSE